MAITFRFPFSKHNVAVNPEKTPEEEEKSSKSRSMVNSFLAAFSTEKYMNDPVRTTNHPDIVGYYYDPMSCGQCITVGYDCTNTGA
jgi:hypothetical protein